MIEGSACCFGVDGFESFEARTRIPNTFFWVYVVLDFSVPRGDCSRLSVPQKPERRVQEFAEVSLQTVR